MTTVTYGKPFQRPITQSADAYMKSAAKLPGLLISVDCWPYILPWLDSDAETIRNFWGRYKTPKATTERQIAIDGPKFHNRQNERVLLGLVHEYTTLSLQSYGFSLGTEEPPSLLTSNKPSPADADMLMEQLKVAMADWVLDAVWNDPDAPKRLHELLKAKKTAQSEYSDQPSFKARIYIAFVQELVQHWKLPTKKAVRKKAGLSGEPEHLTVASRAFGDLGLSGLPQG